MGSLKPSVRLKASHQTIANGTVPHLDAEVLTKELSGFEAETFDADSYVQTRCQTMSEKGIRSLCSELVRLRKASAEEMRRSVYANYAAFIRTSQEISDLEGELLAMRNLLSSQAALIHGLADGVQIDSLSNGTEMASSGVSHFEDDHTLSEDEKRAEALPEALDILIAERRVDEALVALMEGERMAVNLTGKEPVGRSSMITLQSSLSERKARLAEQLVEAARQPSVRGYELRAAISALYRLGDGPHAHTLLLNAHSQRLHYNVQGLRSSGTSYGGGYTAALSQLVFSAISQAAKDSQSIFGDQAAYASELVLWSSNETENFASLIKRHVLSSAAAAGGLRAAAECVQIALGHCSLLEAQGLALSPILLKLFRASVEQALEANLKRIEESVAALAVVDDWILFQPLGTVRSGSRALHGSSGLTTQMKLSSSTQRFQALVQDFFDDVSPLISMQLGGPMLDGLVHLFENYVQLLIKAVPGPEDENWGTLMDNKTVKPAETEHQQLGLLANAYALAEEVLPRVAAKILPAQNSNGREEPRKRATDRHSAVPSRMAELREWRKRLQRMVDRLRDRYCRQQVLDLIYTEDGEANLGVEVYLNLSNNVDDLEPMPSPIFQELFFRLNKLSHIAADVLVGRERTTLLLFQRLVETFVIWLSDDQDFWEDIEDGPNPLGQAGLQQFVLDMQFIIQIASHGRYLNRQIRQVVADIITRAVEAFSKSGLDPNSVLPENEWFLAAAQDSMLKLLADWAKEVAIGDLSSPTASLSAQSISSARSHGSP